jgi:hypothetical protein
VSDLAKRASVLSRRILPPVLTVLGLALLIVGSWFTINLGSSGSATFEATPNTRGVVVLTPQVLNRVNDDVTVTGRAKGDGQVWVGRTTPSDADAVVGKTTRVTVGGAHVRDWSLTTKASGTGDAPATLAAADVWRQAVSGKGQARMKVSQANAPESLVVAAPGGSVERVTLTVERKTWFWQALLIALIGLIATVVGIVGLTGMTRRWRAAEKKDADTEPDPTPTEVSA